MIQGPGRFLWPQSNQSQDHGSHIATSKDRGKAIEASGDSLRATEVTGYSGKEVGASEDSDQKGATKVRDSKTKAEAEF